MLTGIIKHYTWACSEHHYPHQSNMSFTDTSHVHQCQRLTTNRHQSVCYHVTISISLRQILQWLTQRKNVYRTCNNKIPVLHLPRTWRAIIQDLPKNPFSGHTPYPLVNTEFHWSTSCLIRIAFCGHASARCRQTEESRRMMLKPGQFSSTKALTSLKPTSI